MTAIKTRIVRMVASTKISAILCEDEHGALQARHGPPGEAQILPGFRFFRQAAQQIGRVISNDQGYAAIPVQLAAQAPDGCTGVEQRLHGEATHRNDQLGTDELDLALKVRGALRHLRGSGVAVSGRPALEYVGDVDVLAASRSDR